jgi:hypothetical protein
MVPPSNLSVVSFLVFSYPCLRHKSDAGAIYQALIKKTVASNGTTRTT